MAEVSEASVHGCRTSEMEAGVGEATFTPSARLIGLTSYSSLAIARGVICRIAPHALRHVSVQGLRKQSVRAPAGSMRESLDHAVYYDLLAASNVDQ